MQIREQVPFFLDVIESDLQLLSNDSHDAITDQMACQHVIVHLKRLLIVPPVIFPKANIGYEKSFVYCIGPLNPRSHLLKCVEMKKCMRRPDIKK